MQKLAAKAEPSEPEEPEDQVVLQQTVEEEKVNPQLNPDLVSDKASAKGSVNEESEKASGQGKPE